MGRQQQKKRETTSFEGKNRLLFEKPASGAGDVAPLEAPEGGGLHRKGHNNNNGGGGRGPTRRSAAGSPR